MIKYNDLRTRQNEILDFIKKYIAEKKISPSIREIGKAVNLSSPATVYVHIESLINKGYLMKKNNKTLELLVPNEYDPNNSTVYLPLFDKTSDRKNFDNLKGNKNFFPFPSTLISMDSEVFSFVISDNSLIDKGIKDGDIVIVSKENTYKDEEIVICLSDNKVFLGVYIENIKLNTNITILGKVISLYRKF